MIISILLFLFIFFAFVNAKNQNKNKIENKKMYSYSKKESIMTENEIKFYKILKEEIEKKNKRVLCQVALYELVKAKDYKSFNKISRKTIDFVIINENGETEKCIELNDKSHYNKKRIKRDEFIRKVFSVCNIELIEIKAKYEYTKKDIENIVE